MISVAFISFDLDFDPRNVKYIKKDVLYSYFDMTVTSSTQLHRTELDGKTWFWTYHQQRIDKWNKTPILTLMCSESNYPQNEYTITQRPLRLKEIISKYLIDKIFPVLDDRHIFVVRIHV